MASVLELVESATELATIAGEIADGAASAYDTLSSAYDRVSSLTRKILGTASYIPLENHLVNTAHVWIPLSEYTVLLRLLASIDFRDKYQRITAVDTIAAFSRLRSHLHGDLRFPDETVLVCMTLPPLSAHHSTISHALAIAWNHTPDMYTRASYEYYRTIHLINDSMRPTAEHPAFFTRQAYELLTKVTWG